MSRASLSFVFLGIASVLGHFFIADLSHSFVFGVDHADRPILEFLLLVSFVFVVYFLAIEFVRKFSSSDSCLCLFVIVLVAVAIRLVYFSSSFIQEVDPFRYMWDGQAVVQGQNPYEFSPQEAFDGGEAPARVVSDEVEDVFRHVNYPKINSVYPPLAQAVFAVSQWLSPWDFFGFRLLVFLCELLIGLLLVGVLKHLGMRLEWVVVYAWSPLVVKEFANSLHVDVFAVLFLCALLFFVVKMRVVWAFVALACAVLVKWFAVVLLPLLVVFYWGQVSFRKLCLACGVFFGVVVVGFLPFVGVGFDLFFGLNKFLLFWQVNASLYQVVYALVQFFVGDDLAMVRLVSRGVVVLLFGGVCLGLCWALVKFKDVVSFGQACLVLLLSLFLLMPAAHPWYLSWLVPFLVFVPLRSLVLFSGLVFLYYLSFYFIYQHDKVMFGLVPWVEYGVFGFFLFVECLLLWLNRQYQLFCPLPMRSFLFRRV